MSEMNEYTPELYELMDENGNVKKFEMIDATEVDGQQYFALIPAFEGEDEAEALLNDDGELVILKTEEENGEEILVSIEDDDEYEKVLLIFIKRIQEVFEECDCDDDGCECGCSCCCEDDDCKCDHNEGEFVCGCDFDCD